MRPFIERAPAFGKLNLIADIELVEKVSEFTTTVTSSMLELSALRLELESIQLEVQMFSKQLAEDGEERGRMLEYMKQYNIEGRNNPTQFDVLSSNYEREAENANEALEKFSDANERLFKRRMEVTEHSSSYLSVVSQLAIPIVAQMRKELGLAFDQTRFEKLSEDAVSSQQAALQKLIGDVGELAKKEL